MSGKQHQFVLPEGAADLLLIRHGETQEAIRGQSFPMVDGQGDPALMDVGERQAVAVGERLKAEPITAIYVTKMRRTHQTAAPLAAHLGLEPRVDPDLHEVFLGDWDGGEYRFRAAENDPAIQRMRQTEDWGEIPGAESAEAFHTRVRRGLERIAAAHPGELVAVVVHGGVIAAACSMVTGSRRFGFAGANNGSISRIVVGPKGMVLRGFNDVSHL